MVMAAAAAEESRSRYEVKLPGFRFHPTEEELLSFYLKSMVLDNKFRGCDIIGFLDIYKYDPRDLPGLAKIGEREWYFFVPRHRKHGSGGGGRPNRTTESGFWKATGSDRKILSTSDPKKLLGLKKTLVFYQGRAPHGTKTNWVMNEYRLHDKSVGLGLGSPKDIVLCKIYMKATSLKVLEQRAAMELLQEDSANTRTSSPSPAASPSPPMSTFTKQFEEPQTKSFYSYNNNSSSMGMAMGMPKKESEDTTTGLMTSDHEKYYDCSVEETSGGKGRTCSLGGLFLPGPGGHSGTGRLNLSELQVPNFLDSQSLDSFWSQLSPWLENLTPAYLPMC